MCSAFYCETVQVTSCCARWGLCPVVYCNISAVTEAIFVFCLERAHWSVAPDMQHWGRCESFIQS